MFKDLKLSTKLIGGFIIVALIIAVVGVIGLYGLRIMGSSFDIAMEEQYPIADASMESMIALISGRDLMGEFLLNEDSDRLKEAEISFNKSISDFDKHARYIIENGSPELKKLVQKADEYHGIFQENSVELMEHQRLHIDAEAKADTAMSEFDQHADELKELLGNYEQELTSVTPIDEKVDASMEAKTIMMEQVALAEEYMSLDTLEETKSIRDKFKEKDAEFDALEELLTENIKKEHQDFGELAVTLFTQHDEALIMLAETKKHMALVDEFSEKADLEMDKAEELAGRNMDQAMALADKAAITANRSIIGITIAGFIFGILLGLFLSRSISKSLNRVIESLSEGANQVTCASGQVSSSSQSLAECTSEQAAAIEEISASLEEMSSMSRQNADNTNQANSLMTEARQIVASAGESMKLMTRSMEEISTAGQEIGKIIKTIDEIAFQTNLLALNAAVEAARAGEAGQGFAVVADEVRNLAQRAADAAKNTSELIEGTIKKIDQGSQLVKTADQGFTEVAANAGKVGELVGEVAAASREQTQGIDQVNHTIAQMDKNIQGNAANAEESAAASEQLNAQAESMNLTVVELLMLIGGTKGQSAPRTPSALTSKPPASKSKLGSPAGNMAEKAHARPKAIVARANDIIPMGDDFNDF